MFWPGVAGEFMRYLPITVFAVLVSSLLYALLFAPVLGSMFGKASGAVQGVHTPSHHQDEVDAANLKGFSRFYAAVLRAAVHSPVLVFFGSVATLISIVIAYFNFGAGVEFFTAVEPSQTRVQIFARGNFSPEEIR